MVCSLSVEAHLGEVWAVLAVSGPLVPVAGLALPAWVEEALQCALLLVIRVLLFWFETQLVSWAV